jgi:hypothetical protein
MAFKSEITIKRKDDYNMLLVINGTTIKAPSAYKYTRSSLDDGDSSYRDANGILQRCVIREDIIRLDLEWNSADMDAFAISVLLEAVRQPFFEVSYFDPYEGMIMERQFYCSDRVLEMYSFIDDKPVWSKCSFALICK